MCSSKRDYLLIEYVKSYLKVIRLFISYIFLTVANWYLTQKAKVPQKDYKKTNITALNCGMIFFTRNQKKNENFCCF